MKIYKTPSYNVKVDWDKISSHDSLRLVKITSIFSQTKIKANKGEISVKDVKAFCTLLLTQENAKGWDTAHAYDVSWELYESYFGKPLDVEYTHYMVQMAPHCSCGKKYPLSTEEIQTLINKYGWKLMWGGVYKIIYAYSEENAKAIAKKALLNAGVVTGKNLHCEKCGALKMMFKLEVYDKGKKYG